MSVDVCLLSTEEASRFENWGIWPECKMHHHAKLREAKQGIAEDAFRWVGGAKTKVPGFVTMITPVSETNGWVPVPCHREDGTLLAGMRTWGNAKRS